MKKFAILICTFLFLEITSQAQSLGVITHVMSNEICYGGNTGSVSAQPLHGTSPYTYFWAPGSQTTSTITGLVAGTYTITLTDNLSATATATAVITQPSALSVSASVTANINCHGGNTGSVSSTPSNGTSPYTYSWSPVTGTNSTLAGLTAGTYTITVTDNCGATATASATVTQPAALSVSATTTANVTCNGGSTGSVSSTPSNGTSPYTYSWTGGGTNSTLTGLAAGTYTITLTDACGAFATASTTITQPAALSVSASVTTNVSCNGGSNGSVSATQSGGTSPYTYSWTGGGTNSTETGLTAGTYTVTLTDACGAATTASATITQPAAALSVSASAKYSAICPGSSDSLFSTPSGGTSPYTYSWTPAPFGDLTCSTCQKTNSYPFGTTFTIVVTDNNGCTATASDAITIHPFPYVTISGPLNPIAAGRSDTLIANVIGSATYLWSNSATTSSIIVSPSVSTTYFVTATNTYGCYDTAHYTIDTNTVSTGINSSSPIRIVPNSYVNPVSFSSKDSVVWFSFVPTDSNNQIIAYSNFLGMPVPHVHRLTLYNPSKHMLVDEPMPDITGANNIRIDISHLKIDSTYYVRAARTGAHANMPGCNPTGDICNESQRWDFQIAFRTVPVFVPKDSASEPPATNQLYYEDRGQISDLNDIPRFDLKAYTNFASPAVYCSDSAVSFVYKHTDTAASFIDTAQRVDMILTGTVVEPSQPVFKMEEDSNAGYLNYFLGFVPNGVPKVEGYSRLVYKNVYSNVDMQVYSNTVGTKLYFVCNPGGTGGIAGNPADIELKFKGATSVKVNSDSGISVATELGTLSFAAGYAYEDSAGTIVPTHWQANFEAVNSTTVKFHTGAYNTNEPLIIEVDRGYHSLTSYPPIGNLDWSTFFGGTNINIYGVFNDVTHDASGNIYVTGYTTSSGFPVLNGVQMTFLGSEDAVVAAFSGANYSRTWATFYGGGLNTNGGGGPDNVGNSIGIDGSGDVFFTGYTNSTDFPHTPSGSAYYQPTLVGGSPYRNAFIAELSSNGQTAKWSTYYGGSGDEIATHLAVDVPNNYVYVVGYGAGASTPLQMEGSAYYNNTTGGLILKFTTGGIREWATEIDASLNGCAVDASGDFFVTGSGSASSSYPVTTYGNIYAGGSMDAVATGFNTSNVIAWSTYYGGDGEDAGQAITTDASGNAYITGYTYSPASSTTIELQPSGSYYYQGTNGNGIGSSYFNAFIAEFAPISSVNPGNLEWGTYFGGNYWIKAYAITTDASNNLYLTGYASHDAPSSFGLNQPGGGNPIGFYSQASLPNNVNEAFIAGLNSSGYWWGSYLGGGPGNIGYGITDYNASNLYVVGISNYPYVFVDPAGSWFQNTALSFGANIGTVSEFNISSIPTALNEIKVEYGELKTYPNPTSQNITVQMKLQNAEEIKFKLYNLFGELVYSENVNEPGGIITKQISLLSLASGNYILQAITPDKIYYSKITKLQ